MNKYLIWILKFPVRRSPIVTEHECAGHSISNSHKSDTVETSKNITSILKYMKFLLHEWII